MTEQKPPTHAAVRLDVFQATLQVLQTELPMAKVRAIVQELEASPPLHLPETATPGDMIGGAASPADAFKPGGSSEGAGG